MGAVERCLCRRGFDMHYAKPRPEKQASLGRFSCVNHWRFSFSLRLRLYGSLAPSQVDRRSRAVDRRR